MTSRGIVYDMICDAYAKANRFSVRIIAKPCIL